MKYDFEVDARDVYKKVEYRIKIKNSWRVGVRVRLTLLLLKLTKRIYPGDIVIEETNKFQKGNMTDFVCNHERHEQHEKNVF
jgi:hypothetical protein